MIEDNAPVHKAILTQNSHNEHKIIRIEWPANSPDLDPIENIWRILKQRIVKRWPKDVAEVEMAVREEWDKLSLEDIRRYCSGSEMRARCRSVIEAQGGHTK